jgi:mercuric ion transport protein
MKAAMARTGTSTVKIGAISMGGAVAAAFASSLCCLGPLLFAALGLGGAGLLFKLEAYRPYFAALTLALLGAGFYLTYRRPRLALVTVGDGPACVCEMPRVNRLGRALLWVATVLVAGLLVFPYLAPILFQ